MNTFTYKKQYGGKLGLIKFIKNGNSCSIRSLSLMDGKELTEEYRLIHSTLDEYSKIIKPSPEDIQIINELIKRHNQIIERCKNLTNIKNIKTAIKSTAIINKAEAHGIKNLWGVRSWVFTRQNAAANILYQNNQDIQRINHNYVKNYGQKVGKKLDKISIPLKEELESLKIVKKIVLLRSGAIDVDASFQKHGISVADEISAMKASQAKHIPTPPAPKKTETRKPVMAKLPKDVLTELISRLPKQEEETKSAAATAKPPLAQAAQTQAQPQTHPPVPPKSQPQASQTAPIQASHASKVQQLRAQFETPSLPTKAGKPQGSSALTAFQADRKKADEKNRSEASVPPPKSNENLKTSGKAKHHTPTPPKPRKSN